MKKPSPLTLNTDGSRSDQQPSDSFSPVEHGSVKPALGRYKYFADPPASVVDLVSRAEINIDKYSY